MANTPTENLVDWLRDAHAMEEQAEKMLKGQAERLEHYPKLKARIEQHIEETYGQQKLLRSCIERLGSSPSAIKDMSAKLVAFGQSVSGMMVSDEVVKGAMSGYVFEHMEIAAYRVLIAAADELGEVEAKAVFERILQEEIAMADWLEGNLDDTTRLYLLRDERDLQAKR